MLDIFLCLKYNHLARGSLVLTSLYEPLGSRMYEIFWSLFEGGMNFKINEFNLQLYSNSLLTSGSSYFWEPIFFVGDSTTFYWIVVILDYCLAGASTFGYGLGATSTFFSSYLSFWGCFTSFLLSTGYCLVSYLLLAGTGYIFFSINFYFF